MAKEPILRHAEAGMRLKGLETELTVPQADRAVRERGAADVASKQALDARELVLEVLGLVAEGAAGAVGAGRFDGVADAFGVAVEAIGHDGEVGREQAVVVDEDDVREAFGDAGADELRDHLAADRAPGVVDAVGGADGFGVVEGGGGVAVGDDLGWGGGLVG